MCVGRRRLNTISGFQDMGARFEVTQVYALEASAGLNGVEIFMDEASGDCNREFGCSCCSAHGTTRLLNAACGSSCPGFVQYADSMGAKISGIGPMR